MAGKEGSDVEEMIQIKEVAGRHSESEVRWCFDRRSALGLGLLAALSGSLSACSGRWERTATDVISDHSATPSEVRSPNGDRVANGSGVATGIRALSYSRPAIEGNQADRPLR